MTATNGTAHPRAEVVALGHEWVLRMEVPGSEPIKDLLRNENGYTSMLLDEIAGKLPAEHREQGLDAARQAIAAWRGNTLATWKIEKARTRWKLTVLRGDVPVFVATEKLDDAAARSRLLDRVRAELPGVDLPYLERDILDAAAGTAATAGGEGDDGKAERKSIATRVLELVRPQLDLFRDANGEGYADLQIDGHRETHAIGSRAFRDWICGQFFAMEQRAVPANALADVRGTLAAEARFKGPQRTVGVRIVRTGDSVWLDLGDEAWRCVEITADGWSVRPEAEGVRFRRLPTMRSLPVPIVDHGADVDDLARLLAGGEATVRRVIGWLVAALLGQGPFPVLVVGGEQGSAKTSTAETLRSLVDPAEPALRGAPREERDLVIAANNAAIVGLDNLSHVSEWLADGLCRIATGAGFAGRTLYTDAEETTFSGARALLMNGIPDLLVRPDLADRAILLELPAIDPASRREARELRAEFDREHPRILGLLLDLASATMQARPDVRLTTLPRMADYARTLAALDAALGQPDWTLGPYLAGTRDVATSAAGSDPLTDMLLGIGAWSGSSTALLLALEHEARSRGQMMLVTSRAWPGGPAAMSNRLKRLVPALRQLGRKLEWRRTKRGAEIVVTVVTTDGSGMASDPGDDDTGDEGSLGIVTSVVTPCTARTPEPVGAGGPGGDGDDGDDGSAPFTDEDAFERELADGIAHDYRGDA